jgi:DNA gyrase/topoisomerase IV subunit B
MKQILNKFDTAYECIEFENISIAVLKNDTDNYNFIQYINGINVYNGGKPLEYIENGFVQAFRDMLPKKYEKIKPGDIRNKITLVVIFKNMKNPRFGDQIKSQCVNTAGMFSDITKDIDFDKLAKQVYKNKEIKENILEYFDMKVQWEEKKALKDLDKQKPKQIRNEKYLSPIGDNIDIFLAEGDSASASISKILGRENKGYFAMFGVPPNAYDIQTKDIIKSKKLLELKNILNISYTTDIQKDISFKNIIIATDFDLPGHFICGQLLGLFFRFGKNLFHEKRIKRFVTPLVVAKKGEKIIKWFYNFDDYFKFEQENKTNNYKYDYKKGLGSWDKDELDFIIEKDGLDNMIEVFVLDDEAETNIHNWLSANTSDARKSMLEGFKFNIMEI